MLQDLKKKRCATPFRRQTFPQNSHLTVMRWPLAMQYNTHAKPTRKRCDQTSSYRTWEVRPCVHTYEITWAPLQNLPSERLRPTAISCSLPIFISLFSCITLTSKILPRALYWAPLEHRVVCSHPTQAAFFSWKNLIQGHGCQWRTKQTHTQ